MLVLCLRLTRLSTSRGQTEADTPPNPSQTTLPTRNQIVVCGGHSHANHHPRKGYYSNPEEEREAQASSLGGNKVSFHLLLRRQGYLERGQCTKETQFLPVLLLSKLGLEHFKGWDLFCLPSWRGRHGGRSMGGWTHCVHSQRLREEHWCPACLFARSRTQFPRVVQPTLRVVLPS